VLAPTDATVSNRFPDINAPSQRETSSSAIPACRMDYLIDITNLMNVPSAVSTGARGRTGADDRHGGPLGFGRGRELALRDDSFRRERSNTNEANIAPHSVSPDKFMSAEARAQLAVIWQTAAYVSEWCEPFSTTIARRCFRSAATWTVSSGPAPAAIVAGCPTESGATEYSFIDAAARDDGDRAMSVGWSARPTTIDFTSSTGIRRLGLYDNRQ